LLERNLYDVLASSDFKTVVVDALAATPDIILLDLNLPYVDGHVICRELREHSSVPIIVVTSSDSDLDELMAMNLGADDYVTKPYRPQILLARMASVLRRAGGDKGSIEASATLSYQGLELDAARSEVSYGEQSAELTKNELRILQVLMLKSEQIVTRVDLQNELWQSDQFVDDNTLTVNVNRLRTTLSGIGASDVLHTKRGLGYYIEFEKSDSSGVAGGGSYDDRQSDRTNTSQSNRANISQSERASTRTDENQQ
jgi:DNA-binding response OmpR family regulator